MSENLLLRITLDPDICHGKPVIRHMRYPVEMILDLLAAGMSHQEILEDYPALENLDILACLQFATKLTQVKSIYRFTA